MKNHKKTYKSIGEVAKEISTNTHTLRFWEKEFKQIKPMTLTGNRRYYSQKDVNTIKLIKFLLKDQGLTIDGAKKIMSKKVNTLDDYKTSSIKAEYLKNIIKIKSKILLDKIKKIKK